MRRACTMLMLEKWWSWAWLLCLCRLGPLNQSNQFLPLSPLILLKVKSQLKLNELIDLTSFNESFQSEGIRAYHKLPVVNFLYLYKTKKVNQRKGSYHYTGWRIDRPLPYCRQIGSYFFSSSSWKFSLLIDSFFSHWKRKRGFLLLQGKSKKALKEIVKLGQKELKAQKISWLLLIDRQTGYQQLEDES